MFIVYALPRSRSYWLSRFLSYGEWTCGHDELRHARSLDDVKAWFQQPNTGTVETAAAPWWRLVRPDVRVVVLRRPVAEVMASLDRAGMHVGAEAERVVLRLDRKLTQIEQRVPGVLSVSYAELGTEAGCAAVFEHCLPYKHDADWWAAMAPVNLQCNMASLVRYYAAYREPLHRLAKTAKHAILAGMAGREPKETDGLTIREETFEQSFDDAGQLFAEHCVEVGEVPDNFQRKNLPLLRKMASIGALCIMTARSNGRMFGYLVSVIAPSLESADITTATATTFFASKEFPGLGMKLQRAAIETLQARGVNEVFFRAGVRGSGPRMGAMYRRLGAADDGQLFKLNLKVA